MKLTAFMRSSHRVLSIVFTLVVIVNFVARIWGEPPMWVSMLPLPPLFLMLFSGLYLFALPYMNKAKAP